MKLAIITLTEQGKDLAYKIEKGLADDPTILKIDLYHKQVKKTLKIIGTDYDCILGVMASGIMIRSLCGVIRDKTLDPAVLVMDEKSKHVISLLSGHLGGANDYTYRIAEICGADPVITTATDVNNRMGIDSLARKYFFQINLTNNILPINQALAEGKNVNLEVPEKFQYLSTDEDVNRTYKLKSGSEDLKAVYQEFKIVLTPKKLVMGIGSRKGVPTEHVLEAMHVACQKLGITEKRIDSLATADPKEKEPGILEASQILGVPLEIVPLSLLKSFTHSDVNISSFVLDKFGVPGICEPAALYVAGKDSKLIYRKTALNKVTVAVAVSGSSGG